LFVTDIQSHDSLLLAVGAEDLLEALEFKRLEGALYRAGGVVSRKKQLFPAVCRAIATVAEI
jgi:manganese-dependent inorganic pyrophosphatase